MNEEKKIITERQKRTKKHLQQALIELIKKQGYHATTVKDIVTQAAYNRSTFYVHYQDKIELADELLESMLIGLEESVGKPYISGQKVYTDKLNPYSFNVVSYIHTNRNFFELIKYDDTLPALHIKFPQTIMKIYQEKFIFQTINNLPVNMDYFKRYTAYGFYGLLMHWITNEFQESQEEFIDEVINLTKTHMYSFKYIGQ